MEYKGYIIEENPYNTLKHKNTMYIFCHSDGDNNSSGHDASIDGCKKQIDEILLESDLISDTISTYNKTPILPSELLKINEELVEALNGMVWLWDEIIKALPTVKDEVKYIEAKALIQKITNNPQV